MRRDEEAQVERFVRISGLIPLRRINALGLQTPGDHVGDLAHVEIAERAAEYGDFRFVTAQWCRGVDLVSRERRLRRMRQANTFGAEWRSHFRHQAGNGFGTGKRAALSQPML